MTAPAFPDPFARLSTRAKSVLNRIGVKTPPEVCALKDEELLEIDYCGQKTLEEIRQHFPYKPTQIQLIPLERRLTTIVESPQRLTAYLIQSYTKDQIKELINRLVGSL